MVKKCKRHQFVILIGLCCLLSFWKLSDNGNLEFSKNVTHFASSPSFPKQKPPILSSSRHNRSQLPDLFKRFIHNNTAILLHPPTTTIISRNPNPVTKALTPSSRRCSPNGTQFGQVALFIMVAGNALDHKYGMAHSTVHCYAQIHKYKFAVLDADTGITNINRCIEEYLDEKVDLIFYERFFNWEIASGNYMAKNTEFARDFLLKWADYEFHLPSNFSGLDNGALQIHLLKTVLPSVQTEIAMCEKLWKTAYTLATYHKYVQCCRFALGARHDWTKEGFPIKVLRRAHSWAIDWQITYGKWCSQFFMFHSWKDHRIAETWSFASGEARWGSPLKRPLLKSECVPGTTEWPWRSELIQSCENVKTQLAKAEDSFAQNFFPEARQIPYFHTAEIGECWPDCV